MAYIRFKWAIEWSQVPVFAQSNEASMKQAWLDAEFGPLLEAHQAIRATAMEGYDFWQADRLELGGQEDPDAILTPLALAFPHLKSQDAAAFRVFLEAKWQLALGALPSYARDAHAHCTSTWFAATTQALLEAFVTHQGEQNHASTKFWDAVRAELGDTPDSESIVRSMCDTHPSAKALDADAFRAYLLDRWQLSLAALRAFRQ